MHQTDKKTQSFDEYREYVSSRLKALRPVFARAAVGDFSHGVDIPDKDDEFTEFYVGIQIILEVIREKIGVLESRTDELRGVLKKLQMEDRMKDDFLATLAHELRNPLAPIVSSLQLMKCTNTKNDDALCQSVDVMDRQVGHMSRLLDDLLDISRISRGKINLHKELIDIRTVVEGAVETTTPLFLEREQEFIISLPDERVPVFADQCRLEQVVVNLLNNAAKYTRQRGQIWLLCSEENGRAVVRVRDTGMGISAEMLPHVFDLLSQGAPTISRSEGGLGIGLSLVKKLTLLHDGKVEATSKGLGQGSEFAVRVPVARRRVSKDPKEEHKDEVSQPDTEVTSKKERKKILLVDDNVDLVTSMERLLTVLGYETIVAHDGNEALDTFHECKPDVVVLDIGLPGMSGYEVARELREDENGKKVVLVALSGYGQEKDKRLAREAGFDHHLTKPVGVTELQEILKGVG